MGQELDQAEELLRKGRYADAVERFRNLLSSDPENAELRGRMGEAYRLSGNRERAFHHFHKAAAIFTRRNDTQGALRMLKAADSVSPREPDVLFRMAECLKALGLYAELDAVCRQIVQVAIASGDRRRVWALEELTHLHPDDLDVAVRRAQALGEAHRIDDAVTAWKQVSARLDGRAGDFVSMLQQAAALAPERPDIGVDLAGILIANRKARDALAMLVPYYEKYPENVDVLETLLKALEALKAHDKIVAARIELIKARTKLGQRNQTLTDLAKLKEVAPQDPTALEVSAHAYATFGLIGEACRHWYQMAEACTAVGDQSGRDRAILLLLKNNPNHTGALDLGARVLRDAGRPDEAASLERRLREVQTSAEEAVDLPAARPTSLQPVPVPSSQPRWDTVSSSVEIGEEDVVDQLEELSREMTADSNPAVPVLPSDHSDPSVEPMPINKNPWSEGLELEVQLANAETKIKSRGKLTRQTAPTNSARSGILQPVTPPEGIENPFGAITASGPDQDADLVEIDEGFEEVEETTSRMDANEDPDLAALRTDLKRPTSTSVPVVPQEHDASDEPGEEATTMGAHQLKRSPGTKPLRPESFSRAAAQGGAGNSKLVSQLKDEIKRKKV